MKIDLIYFDDEAALQYELGANHDELWDLGLNLDDWDYGFIIPNFVEADLPYNFEGIMQENHKCDVVWKSIERNKKQYLVGMVYHA